MRMKNWLAAGIAMAAALALAGCGGKGKEESVPEAAENAKDDYIYVAEYESLGGDDYAVGNAMMDGQGTVYFVGVKENKAKLFARKMDGSQEEIPVDLDENTMISVIGKDVEGNLLLGLVTYDQIGGMESKPQNAAIRKISADGTVLQGIDTGKTMIKDDGFYMQGLLQDKDGNYYVCLQNSIYVVKQDGQPYCEIDVGTYIGSMFDVKGEKVLVSYFGEMTYELQEVDLAGKRLKALDTPMTFEYGTYLSGGETADILYTAGTKLYTYNLGDEEPVEILNWVDSDIYSENLRNFQILADGRVVAFSVDWSSEKAKSELAVLTKKDRSEVPEKVVLTYGTTYLPYFAKADVVAFNKQSDKYRIEIKEYGEGDKDYETMVSLWSADMSSGDGPDIIDMVYCPVGLGELVSMGAVEDLNPYLDGDADVNREDYVENAMKLYEADGKLYAVMRCFGIDTMIGKESDVGSGTSWTLDDLMALVDSKESDVELFEYTTKYNALQMMLAINGDKFVDEENGTCSFQDGEFIKILEFANRFPQDITYDQSGPSSMEKIRNGKLLLLKETVTSVQQYQLYESTFGEPINMIGYPTSGESGTMITPNGTTVAMNANSKNKEGVWEFMKFLLDEERQENLQSANAGFPVLKSALEKQFEKDMTKEYYEDVDGTQKEMPKGVWTTGASGEVTVDVYAASKEQVDRIRQMIDTAGGARIDSQILSIIVDEAQSYFDGQKKAEDVTGLIQERVQVYLNEKR